MPRFAVLEHDHPTLHWDFLLEHGGVLLTWRLSAPPTPDGAVDAEEAFDHRLVYLDYEGPVSAGRGSVTRWDGGTFDWQVREEDRIAVRLAGGRLRGVFRLERREGGAWFGRFTADPDGQ
jgi:DNA polymerase Ligase (LigD)